MSILTFDAESRVLSGPPSRAAVVAELFVRVRATTGVGVATAAEDAERDASHGGETRHRRPIELDDDR